MATEHSDSIYELRDERMVSPKDGKTTVRIARFLKPCASSVNQAVAIPNVLLLSEIFPHNLQQWPSKVVFKGWKAPQRNWEKWVDRLAGKYGSLWNQSSIFDAIMSSRYEINLNRDLILGLVEFWCPETNTFVFPWGEATITLEDVMILGGFPVLGEPIQNSVINGELLEIVQALNNLRMKISRSKLKKATYSAWMKHYVDEEESTELDENVGFLSLWLSRYAFPSRPESMRKDVFPIAARLSGGKMVALAPAVLASLYRNLTLLKQEAETHLESITLSGPLQLLQLWAFERFPILGSKSPNSLKPGEPRIARWHKLSSTVSLPLVRSVLKLEENFCWRPYAANLENWIHLPHYKEIEEIVFDCSSMDQELWCFFQCLCADKLEELNYKEKYMPHRVAMQFGMDQDLPGKSFECNFTWENCNFFVPSRTFEPAVSARYFSWWRESKLAREDIIKQGGKLINESEMAAVPSGGTEKNKNCHESIRSTTKKGNCRRKTLMTRKEGSKRNFQPVDEVAKEVETQAGDSSNYLKRVYEEVEKESCDTANDLVDHAAQMTSLFGTEKNECHDSVPLRIPEHSESLSLSQNSESESESIHIFQEDDSDGDLPILSIIKLAKGNGPCNTDQCDESPKIASRSSKKRKLPTRAEVSNRLKINSLDIAKVKEPTKQDKSSHGADVNKQTYTIEVGAIEFEEMILRMLQRRQEFDLKLQTSAEGSKQLENNPSDIAEVKEQTKQEKNSHYADDYKETITIEVDAIKFDKMIWRILQ